MSRSCKQKIFIYVGNRKIICLIKGNTINSLKIPGCVPPRGPSSAGEIARGSSPCAAPAGLKIAHSTQPSLTFQKDFITGSSALSLQSRC
ncbi:unnamed protein product, partial [Gulo gulo]